MGLNETESSECMYTPKQIDIMKHFPVKTLLHFTHAEEVMTIKFAKNFRQVMISVKHFNRLTWVGWGWVNEVFHNSLNQM